MGRTPCCNEEGLKKGAWTADEDQKLVAYVQQHGEGGWRTLPQKAGLQRCGKSCRLRWANYLRPDIKRGQFSAEEEQKIIQLHSTLGNRWSAIARDLPKRTDNEIKNYWNTHMKKRLLEMGIDPVTHRQLGLSPSPPSSSNVNSTNVNDSTRYIHDSEIRPIKSSISASAKLLNKVSARFALMQRQDKVSTPSHSLDAIKAVLNNSTKYTTVPTGGGGSGNGSGDSDGNDSDVEMLVSTSVPLRKRFSSQILNKMASKLAASKSFDMLKNRLGDVANSNSSTGGSYNNIESPHISISDLLDKTTNSPTCESSELNENFLYIEEDELNEAFATLRHGIGLESNPSSPVHGYVGNGGAEDGAMFTDSMKENNMADDCQVGINNLENSTNCTERFTNVPVGGNPIEFTSTDYYCGEGESHGETQQENFDYWTQDFDLLNYAMQ